MTVEDVLRALKTLDQASGADSNHFRWRVRMFIRNQEQLAERRAVDDIRRAQAEVAESRF